ncbi:MAG: dephospho-CoA kinase, partial [Lysobacterales bacterium]
ESGRYRERTTRVLVVDCREASQVRRVVARSGMPPDEVRAIIRAQIGREQRLALADDVIDNDEAPERSNGAIIRLDHLYRRLAAA